MPLLSPQPPTPPGPPSPTPPPPTLPPLRKKTTSISLDEIVISKQTVNHQNKPPEKSNSDLKKLGEISTLVRPQPPRTNPFIWCSSILCLLFSLILIFFGITTLIIFLVVKPRNPSFDIPNANLSVIYFDSPEYFNGDYTFLANFSNPNRKIDVRLENLVIEIFFSERLIATQAVQPFTQRRGETRLELVHFLSSLVFLPQNLAVELQKQVQSNRVSYSVRGKYKVKATLGLIHYSYWLSDPLFLLVAQQMSRRDDQSTNWCLSCPQLQNKAMKIQNIILCYSYSYWMHNSIILTVVFRISRKCNT